MSFRATLAGTTHQQLSGGEPLRRDLFQPRDYNPSFPVHPSPLRHSHT